jgi:hypothetical protein
MECSLDYQTYGEQPIEQNLFLHKMAFDDEDESDVSQFGVCGGTSGVSCGRQRNGGA